MADDELTSETMSITDSNASISSSERREMMLELKMLRNGGSEDGECDDEDNDTIDSDLLSPQGDALDALFEDEAEEDHDDEEDGSEEDKNSEPSHWDSEQQSLFDSEDFEQGVSDDERYPLQRLCDEFQRNGYTLYHALMLLTKRCPTNVDGRDAYLQLRDDLDLMHLRLQIQYEEECAAGGASEKDAVSYSDETVVLNSDDDENMVAEEQSDEESERPVRKKKAIAKHNLFQLDMWSDEEEEAEL